MNLLKDKIKPLYFKCLGAAFGSALISMIYSIVDMAMAGQYHGPAGTAALAVASPVWNMIYSLGLLMGIGGSVLFSNLRGQSEENKTKSNEYFTASSTDKAAGTKKHKPACPERDFRRIINISEETLFNLKQEEKHMSKSVYAIEKIGESAYRLDEGGIANCYLLVGKERALLIDTGLGVGELKNEVEKLTRLPVDVALTASPGSPYTLTEALCRKSFTTKLKGANGAFI